MVVLLHIFTKKERRPGLRGEFALSPKGQAACPRQRRELKCHLPDPLTEVAALLEAVKMPILPLTAGAGV